MALEKPRRSAKKTKRIANAIFHLSAFARFPALHCLSFIQGTTYLVMDNMIELNDYYQYHVTLMVNKAKLMKM